MFLQLLADTLRASDAVHQLINRQAYSACRETTVNVMDPIIERLLGPGVSRVSRTQPVQIDPS